MINGVEKMRGGRRKSAVAVVIGLFVALTSTIGVGSASAIPEYTEPNFVTTLKCGSANPWPLGPLPVRVDVYNQIQFPADGLPGPAISLIGYSLTRPQALEYTAVVKVTWRNLQSGRTGSVTVPGRAPSVRWQADLHPGSGPVAFTIHQTIGAMAFVPMVNPKKSTCSGRATA